MGQTSAQAKHEVDETRAHLTHTIEALQLRARENLDLRRQLQTNQPLQLVVGALCLLLGGGVALLVLRRQRQSRTERLVRRLKLEDLRDRLNDFREDARAWTAAQKRLVRADSKSKRAVAERNESAIRRILVSAAEAGAAALAAGYAKRLTESARIRHERAHPTAVVSKQH